jgi:hypothetical protein
MDTTKHAFPTATGGWDDPGMSLRQHYAAQALAGLCACGLWTAETPRELAAMAFARADAMIAFEEFQNHGLAGNGRVDPVEQELANELRVDAIDRELNARDDARPSHHQFSRRGGDY